MSPRTENARAPKTQKMDPRNRSAFPVTLREVSRCLDSLPDDVHTLATQTYKRAGGKPGEWSQKALDAWCHALTAAEDELELRQRNEAVRTCVRTLRRRLECAL